MEKKLFDRTLIVRISGDEKREIGRIANRLSLSQGEVSRRAIRVGLGALHNLNLPGSTLDFKETQPVRKK